MTYGAFQCAATEIGLSCPDNKTIFVTQAHYGQFGYTCTQEDLACCPPNPITDCVESMEDEQPIDWATLKALCDDRTSCSFDVQFATLTSCADPYISEYMTVTYQCLPGEKIADHYLYIEMSLM